MPSWAQALAPSLPIITTTPAKAGVQLGDRGKGTQRLISNVPQLGPGLRRGGAEGEVTL